MQKQTAVKLSYRGAAAEAGDLLTAGLNEVTERG